MSSIVEINPLIRHAQLLTVADSKLYGSAIAYDNRIFLCVDGSGDIVISDIAYPMHSGTLLMWKSGMPYRYAPSSHAPLKMIGFNFDFTKQSENKTMAIPPSKVEVFDSSLMTEQIYFSDVTSFNSPLYLTDMFSLRENFLEIKNEFDNKKRFFMQRCSALFFNILIILARSSELSPVASDKHCKVDEVITYIQENYDKEINNTTLADLFGYHPGYICRLIKKATGTSTHQYLLNYRIARAIEYLQSGEVNISQTCYLCGFHDLAHFSKCFKLKTGYPPSHYIR